MKTVDVTPTWKQILPTWLALVRGCVNGEAKFPDEVMANFEKEMLRMAESADFWNKHVSELASKAKAKRGRRE